MSDLNAEALQSMPPPVGLTFKLDPAAVAAINQPIAVGTIDPRTGQPKRAPGRPRSSTKKAVHPPGTVNPPQTMRGRGTPPKATDTVDVKEATKEQKKLRAEQYATYINTELNDKLFLLISGMPGSPFTAAMFYVEGKVPPSVATNPNYSELGNAVAIPADVAGSWGKLLAELSYTDAGKGLAKVGDNHILTIALAALTAVYSTYRYSQQIKPLLDSIKAAQAAQAAAKEGSNGTTSGEPNG